MEALTPVTLCVFPRAKLWELYSKFPSLAFDVTWLATRQEQLIDENLLSVGRRTAIERTAYVLLHLFVRAGSRARQWFEHAVSVAEPLERLVGVHERHVEGVGALGAARWRDRVFQTTDRAALERIAGDDAGRHKARPFI